MDKIVKARFFILISCLFFMACQVGRKSQNNAYKCDANDIDIPYIVADRYFVKNAIINVVNPKIETQTEFDKIFGTAPVMGKDGLPTTIDFSKQYVIAIVKPETYFNTKLTPLGLNKNANDKIIFSYKVETGEKQTYATVPCLIIVVYNSFRGDIVLKEL